MFRRFEGIVEPYPEALPPTPPRRFAAFMWECTRGLRGMLLAATLVSATIGSFEALLFSMMAHILDVLAQTPPAELWARHGPMLALLGGVLLASIGVAALYGLLKYQGLFINFPMRLR